MTALNRVRQSLEPVIRRVLHLYWWFSRGATLGVRAVVIDAQGRIFMVRHSYVRGWHLPGGGVETGESFLSALKRELHEEGNIALTGAPVLLGIVHNEHVSKRDHVAIYIVREFRQPSLPRPNFEIVESGYFAPDALPDDTWPGTRARIEEALTGKPLPERWTT